MTRHSIHSSSSVFRLATPPGLLRRVLRRIELEKMRQTIRRSLVAWSAVVVVSLAGVIAAGAFFYQEAVTSGLGSYLSQCWALLGANPGLALAHWSDILTSIGESVPIIGLTVVATVIGLVVWSADMVVEAGRKLRTA